MKATRLAPIVSAVALLVGSSAFAQSAVKFRYDVSGGCMTNSAVMAPACGSAVLTQPAVVGGACGSCDPYLPLWQQSVIDAKGCWGTRVSNLPNFAEVAPTCGVMSQAAVIDTGCNTGCGAMLTQPAVLDSCGSVMTQSAIVAPAATAPANVITQPMFIQGTNPYDIKLFSGGQCASTVQEQPAVVEQQQPQAQTATETTTVKTVKTVTTRFMKRVMLKHHKQARKICRHKAKRTILK